MIRLNVKCCHKYRPGASVDIIACVKQTDDGINSAELMLTILGHLSPPSLFELGSCSSSFVLPDLFCSCLPVSKEKFHDRP